MTYVEGFVVPVPATAREAYRAQAAEAAPLFREFGVSRHVEAWGDDVPAGKITDFRRAVKAKDDEEVVFSWFEYPDRRTRDAANEKMMSDPRMEPMGANMPFDGKRMIVGGFAPIVDVSAGKRGCYIDARLVAAPSGNRDAFRKTAEESAALFREHGATRIVEAWEDDVPRGEVTDYRGAVQAEEGEAVVYSWIEWPSKQARDEGWRKMMEDERLKRDMPFDGKRMIYGGFTPILDV